MRLAITIILLTVAFSLTATVDWIRITEEWLQRNPESLPQWLTPEEMLRLDEIGTRIDPTDPPPFPVRCVAEFEPLSGVLIRYPLGIPAAMVAHMSQHTRVVTIVSGQTTLNQAMSTYNNNGANMANCEFIIAPTDSYWTRDYGPLFIFDGNNELGVVNFSYNRPRPNDDNIPVVFANQYDLPLYGMNIAHTGGNFMSNSYGTGASTQIVYTENSAMTPTAIDQLVENYLGITDHIVVQDPTGSYINHIDCWGKFLAPDKILIRSVPESHSQYDELEEVVEYFAGLTSSYGTPYRIYRVYTPNNQPYTNSVIINDKVYVPTMNSTWDSAAIATYQEAMPGYEIIGVYSSQWLSTDAIHCRVKEIADEGMLYIRHLPLLNEQPYNTEYQIDAHIYPYSGEALYADSLLVYYKINSGAYQSISLTDTGEFNFTSSITEFAVQDTISYFIYAADESGRNARHPFIGAPDPHRFVVQSLSDAPAIYHTPLSTVYLSDLPVLIEAVVTDPAGINFVELEYRVNDGNSQFIQLDLLEGDSFTCYLGEGLQYNDLVEYRLIAENGNDPVQTSYLPAEGWFSFTVEMRQLTPLTFSPDPGEYTEELYVTIECETEEAIIYFTLDESIPGEESLIYTEPIKVSVTTTVKARAYLQEYHPSEVAIALYEIEETGVDELPFAESTRLNPAYPNPFNPSVNISYNLANDGFVSIDIFNVRGKKIKTILSGHQPRGEHNIVWNGRDEYEREAAAGVYFYRLQTEHFAQTRKMILLK